MGFHELHRWKKQWRYNYRVFHKQFCLFSFQLFVEHPVVERRLTIWIQFWPTRTLLSREKEKNTQEKMGLGDTFQQNIIAFLQ